MTVMEGGHIPFDEVPECNQAMVDWLDTVVVGSDGAADGSSKKPQLAGFQWPF